MKFLFPTPGFPKGIRRDFFNLVTGIIFLGLMLSAVYLWHGIADKHYVVHGSDSYYYAALADGYSEYGTLMNMGVDPAEPPHTLQNGVAACHLLMNRLNIPLSNTLILLSILHYVAWISAAYPFSRILVFSGIHQRILRAFLLAGFIGSGWILRYQISPSTDGIFHAGFFWLLFLLLRNARYAEQESSSTSGRWRLRTSWCMALILSGVCIHFSIRLLVVPVSFLLAALALRRRQLRVIGMPLACIVVSLLSQFMGFLAIDTTKIFEDSSGMFFRNLWDSLQWIGPVVMTQHAVAFHGWGSHLAAASLLLFLVASIWRGWRNENVSVVTVVILILVSFPAFVLSLPPGIVMDAGPRYVVYTMPLIWLLLAQVKATRPIAILLIVIDIARSCMMMYIGSTSRDKHAFFAYLHKKPLRVPEHVTFQSQHPRQTYALISGRHRVDLCEGLLEETVLWVAGDRDYQEDVRQSLLDCGYEVVTKRLLSVDYHDNSGYSIQEWVLALR
jgi:hypothetical protein